jgi:ATP-dependent exoDNAse (exonuclease V) alpha subunit
MTQDEALNLLKLGHNCFITGAAGTGKTYVLNQYIKYLKDNGVVVAVTASTGIAATHMDGITIHSWSGIHLDQQVTQDTFKRIKKIAGVEDGIKSAKVLIIDEVSMLHSYRLDMVNFVCRRVRCNNLPFGGLQVIMSGDFFQLPPVQDLGEPEAKFVVDSGSWDNMDLKICYLTKQYRQDDKKFLHILNEMRDGQVHDRSKAFVKSRLNKSVKLAIDVKVTQLYTTNHSVDGINSYELRQLDSKEVQYIMAAKGVDDLVKKLKKSCMAPEDLRLKIGAVVMFVRNNFGRGYVNGTLGKVVGFDEESGYPIVETIHKKEIIATPETWRIEHHETVIAEISQVPLRLAWAITVHKSQGMSLDAAVIDLSKAFVEGMGYVALSRVRRLEGIQLLGINEMAFEVHPESILLDHRLQEQSQSAYQELRKLSKLKMSQRQKQVLELMKDDEA